MPQAKRKTTTRHAPAEPAINHIDPSQLPDVYGMRVAGDCMAPEIPDGSLLHFDKREPVKAGDTVIIYARPELVRPGGMQAQVKRLVLAIPDCVKFPFRQHPDSNVSPLIIAEMLNPPRQLMINCSDVLAVHKCMGPLSEDQVTGKIPAPKLRRVRR